MKDKHELEEYKSFVKEANHADTDYDEYTPLAATDAVTSHYGLDSYPSPRHPNRRSRSAPRAGSKGGVFCF